MTITEEYEKKKKKLLEELVRDLTNLPFTNTVMYNDERTYNEPEDVKKELSESLGNYLSACVGREITVCIRMPVEGHPNGTINLSYIAENDRTGKGYSLADIAKGMSKK